MSKALHVADDAITLIGEVTVTVRDKRGRFRSRRVYRNMLMNFARSAFAQWAAGQAANWSTAVGAIVPPSYIALGNGSGTITPNDTVLFAEVASTRKACSYRQVYQQYYALYNASYQTSDPTGTFTEAGLFDAAVGGNLWAHVAINVTKNPGETLTVQWKIFFKGN